jgi:hypothetical protein
MLENQLLCAKQKEENATDGIPTPAEILTTGTPVIVSSFPKIKPLLRIGLRKVLILISSLRPLNIKLTISIGQKDIRGNNRAFRQLQHLPKCGAT